MEKPENLYVQPMDMNCAGGMLKGEGGWYRQEEEKEEKKIGTTVIA